MEFALSKRTPAFKQFAFKYLRVATVVLCVIGVSAGGWAGYLRLTGNVHVVEDGVLYRSAQLSGSQLQGLIQTHGIKTIINLRGQNPTAPWYADELKASSTAQVTHIDFRLSAGSEVSAEKVRQLVGLLRDVRRPILVHCEGGADRSGFVSALFELTIAKRPATVAADQLSFRFGHFPWLGSRTVAMDNSFRRVVDENSQRQAGEDTR